MMTHRRTLIASLGALLAMPALATKPQGPTMEVWKDPNCGCCKDWVKHLEQAGFAVRVFEQGNEAKRAALGMPQALGSCHTGVVGGYAIEGHVPARDIQRLLREKPKALGLSVPGMPIGSPGMDGAMYKGRKDPFDVLLVAANGNSTVFQSYR